MNKELTLLVMALEEEQTGSGLSDYFGSAETRDQEIEILPREKPQQGQEPASEQPPEGKPEEAEKREAKVPEPTPVQPEAAAPPPPKPEPAQPVKEPEPKPPAPTPAPAAPTGQVPRPEPQAGQDMSKPQPVEKPAEPATAPEPEPPVTPEPTPSTPEAGQPPVEAPAPAPEAAPTPPVEPATPAPAQPEPVEAPARELSPIAAEITTVLEQDLEDVQLEEQGQATLNQAAEKTAAEIEGMVGDKVNPSKINKIVDDFLEIIPDLSPQFRIQAAKIKTDGILEILTREAAKREYIEKRRVT